MDNRGQSVVIAVGIATLFGVAVFYLLLNEAWIPLHNECSQLIDNSTGVTTCSWIGLVWDWQLVFYLAITITGTIAAAAFQRQGGFG